MISNYKNSNTLAARPSGFTLVEMLVSVTLVLLMMSMFATVFSIATDSVSQQQANSENDQKARSLLNVIRTDFEKRTFRDLQPFTGPWTVNPVAPIGESSLLSPTSFGNRSGYFYLSVNDLATSSDDLIQFTIDIDQRSQNTDGSLIFGRAAMLVDPITGNASLSGSPNQPELDDGQLNANSTASSSAAEISYFLRNGNLYRRQMLIREPLGVAGGELSDQPASFANNQFFAGYTDDTDEASRASSFDGNFRMPGPSVFSGPATFSMGDDTFSNDFYLHFDYSAIPQFTVLDSSAAGVAYQTARFVGVSALSNENSNDGGPLVSLGKPRNRFGFDILTGFSREHLRLIDPSDTTSIAVGFTGRFLHAETSSLNFNYPQQLPNVEGSPATTLLGGNPYDIGTSNYTMNSNGVIAEFDSALGTAVGRGGIRAQEDLIMSNVHEFRIEVLDERLGDFVAPGHGNYSGGTATGVDGDFHIARLLNTTYGPDNRPRGNVFDTWHPENSVQAGGPPPAGTFGALAGQRAPYELYTYTPPTVTDGGIMRTGVPIETGNRGYWQAGSYDVGDVVFAFVDANGVVWDPNNDPVTPPNGQFDVHGVSADQPEAWEYQVAFRCVATDDPGGNNNGTVETGALQPIDWATTPGRRTTDGEVTWEAIDNTKSLKAVRLTIRFRNEKSGDMRQLTMVLPLADNN